MESIILLLEKSWKSQLLLCRKEANLIIKYDVDIDKSVIQNNIKRIINQVYKLLPMREENIDWQKPLQTSIEELVGMSRLLINQQKDFFTLLCKLQGLFELTKDEDFLLYRRIIFECLSLLDAISHNV